MAWSSVWTIWRKPSIKLGGRRLPVRPLTLENILALALLLAPYLARVEEHWPNIQRALETTGGQRPRLLTATFTALRDELASMPGDMVRAMALLLDVDPLDVAGQMTAPEFVEALPVLDQVNDLAALWDAIQALGLTARYKNGKQ